MVERRLRQGYLAFILTVEGTFCLFYILFQDGESITNGPATLDTRSERRSGCLRIRTRPRRYKEWKPPRCASLRENQERQSVTSTGHPRSEPLIHFPSCIATQAQLEENGVHDALWKRECVPSYQKLPSGAACGPCRCWYGPSRRPASDKYE